LRNKIFAGFKILVLVLDDQQRLTGILSGRDAVRTLAEGKSAKEIAPSTH
jgi:hypothetical protein